MLKKMFIPVENRFVLNNTLRDIILSKKPNFGYKTFSEIVFYDHYSRVKKDNTKETWNEVIIRCVEGMYSILKNHYIKNHLYWDDNYYQTHVIEFAEYMFDMKFLPPGRSLYCMGTDLIYEQGSMFLNNCGAVSTENLIDSACWTLDAMMCGTGVGFDTKWNDKLYIPNNYELFKNINNYKSKNIYVIDDSREGWVDSLRVLLNSFVTSNNELPIFDYSTIRPKGTPLKKLGGLAGGPEILRNFHERVLGYVSAYLITQNVKCRYENVNELTEYDLLIHKEALYKLMKYLQPIEYFTNEEIEEWITIPNKTYGTVRFICDIFNSIGSCVEKGSVRRSAEISISNPNDMEFYTLKDYSINPERRNICWLSNNTVSLRSKDEFSKYIPFISNQLKNNGSGEPGLLNLLNIKRYGRVNAYHESGDLITRENEPDTGTLLNPCGETILNSYELCCLSEIFISRCCDESGKFDVNVFMKAAEYASLFAMAVSILPTHSHLTNSIIAKNHRLGISISGVVLLLKQLNYSESISIISNGYKYCRKYLKELSSKLGVCEPIRITVIKPSGTISLLVGSPSGAHYSVENRYVIRRKKASKNSPIAEELIKCGFPYEQDIYNDNNWVFSYPLDQGDCYSENDVNIYEQLNVVSMLQRRWADNSVSYTAKYNIQEKDKLEEIISSYIPNVKALSFLPKSDTVYKQAPFEKITKQQYDELVSQLKLMDWSCVLNSKTNTDSDGPKFCDGDKCVM